MTEDTSFSNQIDLMGRIIAARRSYLRLTMRDIKERTGIDIGTLSLYERGKITKGHRLDILAKLAVALDMPLEELLGPFIAHVREQRQEYKTDS